MSLALLFTFPFSFLVVLQTAQSVISKRSSMSQHMLPQIEVYTPRDRDPTWPSTLAHDKEEVYPPLIMHIKSGDEEFVNLFSLVDQYTELSKSLVHELLEFGAVYWCGCRDKTNRRMSLTEAVQSPIAPQTYIRIHVNPKRYPEATMIPWNDRIIYQDDELIVIDKPSAVPCSGGIDNLIENVEGQVALILGQQVHVTGRLDVCTSGVVVLAKKPSGAAFMNQLLSSKKTSDDNNEAKSNDDNDDDGNTSTLTKRYIVLCKGNCSGKGLRPGVLKHCFRLKGKHPGLLSTYSKEKLVRKDKFNYSEWKLAELNVISVQKINLSDLTNECEKTVSIDGLDVEANYYECECELITGRTHQIRLQFAAIGYPLVGDTRYAPVSGMLHNDDDGDHTSGSQKKFGPDPLKVGLHCNELSIRSSLGDVMLETGDETGASVDSVTRLRSKFPPWWRRPLES